MQDLPGEWSEAAIIDHGLPAAAVIESARQINHRQRRRLSVFWAMVAEVGLRFVIRLDNADHRCRCPVALAAGNRYRSVSESAEAVGIAKSGGQDFNFVLAR